MVTVSFVGLAFRVRVRVRVSRARVRVSYPGWPVLAVCIASVY